MSAPELAGFFCQSECSAGRSLLKLPELAGKVNDWKMPAFGVSDFSSLAGSFAMGRMLDGSGALPVYGCRISVSGFPLALLAKNRRGFLNMLEIIGKNRDEGDVPESFLSARSAGLYGISGGFEGEIAGIALSEKGGRETVAAARAAALSGLFERDSFCIGLDHDGSPDSDLICSVARQAAARAGCGLVAVNDARHMPGDRGFYERISRFNGVFAGFHDFSLRSPDELFGNLLDSPAIGRDLAVKMFGRSVAIAKNCRFSPAGLNASIKDDDRLLAERARRALSESGLSRDPAYASRLELELSAFAKGGFSPYILRMAETVALLKENGVPTGPGRGSAPGSLVCHALGISEADPLKYGLSFERFFNEWRSEPPDIDIDVPSNRREEAAVLIRSRFGEKAAMQPRVATRFRPKSAVRQAARILRENGAEISADLEDTAAEGADRTESVAESRRRGFLRGLEREGGILLDMAERIDGTTRGFSPHPSGICVSPGGGLPGDGGLLAEDMEDLGFFKFDILGVDYLAALERAAENLAGKGGEIPDFRSIPLDDPDVFALFSKGGELSGVFQMGGDRMREISERMKPRSIDDLAALIALYRPGPLSAGITDSFLDRREGRQGADYFGMPEYFGDILSSTHGLPIYQEQIMEMAARLAGMDMAEADRLRRAIKGGSGPGEGWRGEFIEKELKNGVPRKKAAEMAGVISRFSEYGFNRSHAVSYAIFSYRTAWFKTRHYPEYMAALINVKLEGRDSQKRKEAARLIDELKDKGLLLPPSIMKSGNSFEALDGKVLSPLPLPAGHPVFGVLPDLRRKWKKTGAPKTTADLAAESPLFDAACLSALAGCGAVSREPRDTEPKARSGLPVFSGLVLDFRMIGDKSLKGTLDAGENRMTFIIPASLARDIRLAKGERRDFAGIFNKRYNFLEVRGIAEPAPRPESAPAERLVLDFGKIPQARHRAILKMLAALKGGEGLEVVSDRAGTAGSYANDGRVVSRIRALIAEKNGSGLDLPRVSR